MKRTELISILRRYFAGRREVAAVYLYGSRASRRLKPWSDVDVAVLLSDGWRAQAFAKKIQYSADLGILLSREADVAILNEADPLLRMQALSRGIEVLARGRRRLDSYRCRALRDYWDFLPTLRLLNAAAIRRLGGHPWTGI